MVSKNATSVLHNPPTLYTSTLMQPSIVVSTEKRTIQRVRGAGIVLWAYGDSSQLLNSINAIGMLQLMPLLREMRACTGPRHSLVIWGFPAWQPTNFGWAQKSSGFHLLIWMTINLTSLLSQFIFLNIIWQKWTKGHKLIVSEIILALTKFAPQSHFREDWCIFEEMVTTWLFLKNQMEHEIYSTLL